MTHPGTILDQKMKEARMHRSEAAKRTGVTEKHICTVVNGQRNITPAFAQKLGYVFEIPSFWLELQAEYDEEQLRVKEEQAVTQQEISILKPLEEIVGYFIEQGDLHGGGSDAAMVMQLRKLLRVSSLMSIPEISLHVDDRVSLSSNAGIDPFVLFAWNRLCELKTESVETEKPFDVGALHYKIREIRDVMFCVPDEVPGRLQDMLAECGVVFRVVKNFRGAPAKGFVKHTWNHRVLFCMTVPHQRVDAFWQALFHELSHILNSHLGVVRYVDFDSAQGRHETNADEFARDTLILPSIYRRFLESTKNITWGDVVSLAQMADVLPCIALARLQHDGLLDWTDYPDKVMKYPWA